MANRRPASPDPSAADTGESFAARWSRRKREAEREREAERRQRRQPGAEPEAPDPDAPPASEPEPSDADLPPVETLGEDSDYSGYLSGRVSEDLRRAALRRLFRLPQFNVRDGLDDYDEDYRSFAALGDTITADMRHHRERLREKARRADEEARHDARESEPAETAADADAVQDDAPGADESRGDDAREPRGQDEGIDPADEDTRYA